MNIKKLYQAIILRNADILFCSVMIDFVIHIEFPTNDYNVHNLPTFIICAFLFLCCCMFVFYAYTIPTALNLPKSSVPDHQVM